RVEFTVTRFSSVSPSFGDWRNFRRAASRFLSGILTGAALAHGEPTARRARPSETTRNFFMGGLTPSGEIRGRRRRRTCARAGADQKADCDFILARDGGIDQRKIAAQLERSEGPPR